MQITRNNALSRKTRFPLSIRFDYTREPLFLAQKTRQFLEAERKVFRLIHACHNARAVYVWRFGSRYTERLRIYKCRWTLKSCVAGVQRNDQAGALFERMVYDDFIVGPWCSAVVFNVFIPDATPSSSSPFSLRVYERKG